MGSYLLAIRAAQPEYFWHRPLLLSDSCYVPVSLEFGEGRPTPGVGKGGLSDLIFPGFCTQRICLLLLSRSLLKCRCINVEYYFHESH